MIDKIKNWAYSKNVGFWLTGNLIGWAIVLTVLIFAF